MNIELFSNQDIERALAEKMRELFQDIPWLQNWDVKQLNSGRSEAFDILARIPLRGGGRAKLYVACKKELRPSVFPTLINRTVKGSANLKYLSKVLGMPFITPRMANLCKENDWSWFDLAGNCRLNVPGVLLLERTGNAPVHARQKPTANLSTAEAARILRALLAPENAKRTWTQRAMHTHCHPNVSLGLVNKVVQHLRDEAYIEQFSDGGFGLREPLALLEVWKKAYRFERHTRRECFTLLKGRTFQDALKRLNKNTGGHIAYSCFSAAEFQAPNVRQNKTWIFLEREFENQFKSLVEAKEVDSGSNVVLFIPEDAGVFYELDYRFSKGQLPCTNAIQTYLDLSHCGGRGLEAAEAILKQILKPAYKGALLQ